MSTRMKLIVLLLLTSGIWAGQSRSSQDEAAIRQAVLAANTRITAAANALDVDTMFDAIVNTDQRLIIQDGRLLPPSRQARETIRRGFAAVASIHRQFDHTEVTVLSGDTALLVGTGSSTVTLRDGQTVTSPFAVSNLFILQEGQWKILHGHYSLPNRP